MLQLDTTLSEFLNKYKISVDIDNKLILIGDNKYPILSNEDSCPYCLNNKNTNICTGYNKCKLRRKLEILSLKLYKYGATIEFFIYSELSNMEGYSTINRYPEILDTIEGISSHIPNNKISKLRLGCDWEKQKNVTL